MADELPEGAARPDTAPESLTDPVANHDEGKNQFDSGSSVARDDLRVSAETAGLEELSSPELGGDSGGGLDEAKVLKIAQRIAAEESDRKSKEAEERAFRRAQSKFDQDLARLRRQNQGREQELLAALPQLGLGPEQIRALQEQRFQRDALEALKERAAQADAYDAQFMAIRVRNEYMARRCRDMGVDPNDPRLDASEPEKFEASLLKAAREDARKRGTGDEQAASRGSSQRSARLDLDVLSGGGGGTPETYDPYGDPNESLSKGLRKTFQRK